jgi:hypothetical protein
VASRRLTVIAALFAAIGALLLAVAVQGLATSVGSDNLRFWIAALVGGGLLATGIGIAMRQRWARFVGLLVAIAAIVYGLFILLFVTLMSASVGIGFGDRLFVEPFLFGILTVAVALACAVILSRSGASFRAGR